MAFRKKATHLLEYEADIYVIQESEETSKLDIAELKSYPNRIWVGNNNNKGLLIMAKEHIQIEKYKEYNDNYKYILPLRVSGKLNFNMFAVWTQNDKENRKNRYIGQLWLALQEYKHLLEQDTVIIGDLNSNAIWDHGNPKVANHSQTVAFLAQNNIASLYHLQNNEKHGEESIKTLAFRKDITNGYHIDYCFLSNSIISSKNTKADILPFEDWITKSDHVPLIIDL
jgi:exodeoxyribonuclease-3